MQIITSTEQITDVKDNMIVGNIQLNNSKIIFNGTGNILITPPTESSIGVTLQDTTIQFNNDNSVVFLCESEKIFRINLSMHNNNVCYIGENNFFNGTLYMQCSEQSSIIIGNDNLFSFGIWIRTSDVHLIYDVESKTRINISKSVFIGDHVWIGQDARLWKGTQIGSGAILGASAFSAGKRIPSNTIWGGNPARLIKDGTFFIRNPSHSYTDVETNQMSSYDSDDFIYRFDKNETLDFHQFEKSMLSFPMANERMEFLLDFQKKKLKNRFFIKCQ